MAVSSSIKPGFSIIIPILSVGIFFLLTFFPKSFICPISGTIKPQIHFISTVLPQPFLPTRPQILPLCTDIETLSSTFLPEKVLLIFVTSITFSIEKHCSLISFSPHKLFLNTNKCLPFT